MARAIRWFPVAVLSLLSAAPPVSIDAGQARPPQGLSSAGRTAWRQLVSADAVEDMVVGIAGAASGNRKAFAILVKEAVAVPAFRALTLQGTPAGQIYGLAGLWLTDGAEFRAAQGRLEAKPNEPVPKMSGCVIDTLPMREAVDRVRSGGLDGVFDGTGGS